MDSRGKDAEEGTPISDHVGDLDGEMLCGLTWPFINSGTTDVHAGVHQATLHLGYPWMPGARPGRAGFIIPLEDCAKTWSGIIVDWKI